MIRTSFPAPSAVPTIGHGPADHCIPVHFCVHLPAGKPFVDLAQAITDLTDRLGGYWNFQYTPADGLGDFHIHFPQEVAP